MTITLTLRPETERKLREQAALTGRDVSAVVQDLVERSIAGEPTLAQILAPFRQQVAASGMTDAELDDLFNEARDDVWRQRPGG